MEIHVEAKGFGSRKGGMRTKRRQKNRTIRWHVIVIATVKNRSGPTGPAISCHLSRHRGVGVSVSN
jgi:hypothetical protein